MPNHGFGVRYRPTILRSDIERWSEESSKRSVKEMREKYHRWLNSLSKEEREKYKKSLDKLPF